MKYRFASDVNEDRKQTAQYYDDAMKSCMVNCIELKQAYEFSQTDVKLHYL